MALYSDFHYDIHIEFILGYLAMFVACLALICALSCYTSCLLRLDDLGTLCGFPPIATKCLGINTNLGAIGGFYGTETVIRS